MTTQITALDEPAIWLGCLSCYNNGRLNGKWITAEMAAEPEAPETLNGLAEQVQVNDYTASRCRKCFGDEFDVMDHQLIPKSCANAKDFYDNAEQLAELHNNEKLALIVILANNIDVAGHMSLDELVNYHDNYYMGEFTLNELIEAEIEQGLWDHGTLKSHYIDVDAIVRDLKANSEYLEDFGHVWRNQ